MEEDIAIHIGFGVVVVVREGLGNGGEVGEGLALIHILLFTVDEVNVTMEVDLGPQGSFEG